MFFFYFYLKRATRPIDAIAAKKKKTPSRPIDAIDHKPFRPQSNPS